jgi:hypothetical protein
MLASAIGQGPVADHVVVNERMTVATGFAFAQFIDGSGVDGTTARSAAPSPRTAGR